MVSTRIAHSITTETNDTLHSTQQPPNTSDTLLLEGIQQQNQVINKNKTPQPQTLNHDFYRPPAHSYPTIKGSRSPVLSVIDRPQFVTQFRNTHHPTNSLGLLPTRPRTIQTKIRSKGNGRKLVDQECQQAFLSIGYSYNKKDVFVTRAALGRTGVSREQ